MRVSLTRMPLTGSRANARISPWPQASQYDVRQRRCRSSWRSIWPNKAFTRHSKIWHRRCMTNSSLKKLWIKRLENNLFLKYQSLSIKYEKAAYSSSHWQFWHPAPRNPAPMTLQVKKHSWPRSNLSWQPSMGNSGPKTSRNWIPRKKRKKPN